MLLTFLCAIGIIWLGVSGTEFKITSWGDNQLMFNPARAVTVRQYTFYVADIMKISGAIQLAFAWLFSVIDAGRRNVRIR